MAVTVAASTISAWGQQPLHEQVFASPQWKDFRDVAMARGVYSVSEADLQHSCLQALDGEASNAVDAAFTVCVKAAIKKLGTNAAYYSSEEVREWKSKPGTFAGIGLDMRVARGSVGVIEIVSVHDGAPAEKAGLLPGDQITSVAGRPTFGVPLADSVQAMRGVPGSFLNLRVRRQGVSEPLRFSIQRETLRVQSVKAGMPSPGILWIRLAQLRDETRRDVVTEMARWERRGSLPLAHVILDLRDCQGGLLEAVSSVAALWTRAGTPIVRKVERAGPPGHLYRAARADGVGTNDEQASGTAAPAEGPLYKLPLAILVGQRTASGAEALAQALREGRDARVFGRATFGMAEVDTILPLQSGAVIRVATGRLESPNGFSWASKGIQPDVPLPENDLTYWTFGELPDDKELAAVLMAIGENGGNDSSARHRAAGSR